MPLFTGSITNESPSDALSDLLKTLVGGEGIANWSFVENIPAGSITNMVQQLVLTGWGAGDSFKITWSGSESAAINYDSNISATLDAQLEALLVAYLGTSVSVSRVDANTYNITFNGSWVAGNTLSDFTVTSAVGCSGIFTVTTAPIPTSGSSDFSVDVYKCAGTGDDANDAGVDWYVGIYRHGFQQLYSYHILAEGYNSTDKRFSGYSFYKSGVSSSGAATDASGYPTYGGISAQLPATGTQIFNSYGACSRLTLTTTGFSYWIHITKNSLVISVRSGLTETYSLFALIDSFVDASLNDTLPLVDFASYHVNSQGGQAGNHLFTKLPGVLSQVYVQFLGGTRATGWTANGFDTFSSSLVTGGADFWQVLKMHFTRLCVYHAVSSSYSSVYGCVRGLLKDDFLAIRNNGSWAFGDTITIGTDTWVAITDGVGHTQYQRLFVKET